MKTLTVNKALLEKALFVDTRTPKEFQEDHLPNAINIPILDNEERAIVGTLYKQASQDKAIEVGVEFFLQKLPDFMEAIEKFKDQKIIVYCWRGGMRSKAITESLDMIGYNVLQMEGGYKKYREHVRERLEKYQFKPKMVVLWGLTCTGKTKLLQEFSNSLDLEGLAQHRSSVYGAIGLKPNSQKRFDTVMLQRLDELNTEKFIYVEGESRKIGDVQIPDFFFRLMKRGTHVLIRRSMEKRGQLVVDEYCKDNESVKKIIQITRRLNRVISNENKDKTIKFFEEGNYLEGAKILLEFYYDPLYSHTLKEIDFSFEVDNDDVQKAAKVLRERF
jgi:tRNA 2-selenouridine synthase